MRINIWMSRCVLLLMLCASAAATATDNEVIVYPAYGNSMFAAIEGRVIERHDIKPASASDGRLANAWRNAKLMANDERRRVSVELQVNGQKFDVRTDGEGYFSRYLTDAPAFSAGWHRIAARQGKVQAEGGLLIVPPENRIGVISDLDDTLLVSNVNQKKVLLANTFLKNPLQRQAVAGTADFIRAVAARNPMPDAAPIIYLSASPRQLHGNIDAFLKHNGFPQGVLLTKRVTNDRSSDPIIDQVAYKTAKIEEILARLPQVRFVLMGDDGEYDPEIYHRIRERFPDRVEQILIRRVHPDPKRVTYPEQLDLTKVVSQLTGKNQ